MGSNLMNHLFAINIPTADLPTDKLLFNSINSVMLTPNAKSLVTDMKDFYLNTTTTMECYKYILLPVHVRPVEIIQQYNLHRLIHNNHTSTELQKSMYGLPQAGKLANQQLREHLAKFGNAPTQHTPGL